METIVKRDGPRLKVKVTVYPSKPHVKSPASGILLRKMYRGLDEDRAKPMWQRRLDFNTAFLVEQLLDKGELVCVFCGKGDLVIDSPTNGNLATSDHFMPTSKGGAMFDRANLVCACFRCNNRKADKVGYYDESGKAAY